MTHSIVWRTPHTETTLEVDYLTDGGETVTDQGDPIYELGGSEELTVPTISTRVVWRQSSGNRVIAYSDAGS